MISIKDIARVCHEANISLCWVLRDTIYGRNWGECPKWQHESAIRGVRFVLAFPDAPASAQHDVWMADKVRDGWVYGPNKDPERKTHSCIVPFEALPAEQQVKNFLFRAIVNAFVISGIPIDEKE